MVRVVYRKEYKDRLIRVCTPPIEYRPSLFTYTYISIKKFKPILTSFIPF